jgi:hypothetical protein
MAGSERPGIDALLGGDLAADAVVGAVRYEARAKKPIAAWILWILGPFLLHVPVHDFYLGGAAQKTGPGPVMAASPTLPGSPVSKPSS